MSKRITAATVNKMLRSKGVHERIVRHPSGWYLFQGGESSGWASVIVAVSKANDMSLDQWWSEYISLKNS